MLRPVQAARTLSTAGLSGHQPVCAEGADHLRLGRHAVAGDRSRAGRGGSAPDRRTARSVGSAGRHRQAADAGRRRRHQPVRPAPGRLGRDARPRHGRPRGDRTGGDHPFGRAGAEERHRPRSVQAADRQPRHAGGHHRDHPEGAAGAGSDRHAGAAGSGCRRRCCRPVRGAGFAVRRFRCGLAAGRGGCPRAGPRRDRRIGHADPHRGVRAVGHLSHRPAEGPVRRRRVR